MKKIGLVGGTGPESTLMYYKELNTRIDKRTGGKAMPDLAIESVDFRKAWGFVSSGQYDKLSDYLAEKIPVFADEILSSDSFWTMLQEKALPALQLYVVRQLRGDGDSLLAKIDIPGKIEDAVDKMNMKELHHFVVKASNDNLTVLQVFGFFLGAAAGVIMALVL